MKIVTLTNAYGPRTGGVRTQIDALRRLYHAAGHETVLIHPAERDEQDADAAGPVYRLRAPQFPLNRDYRNLWALDPVARLVDRLAPDSVEVVDKWTLPRLAGRLRARGLPVLGFSCERLDRVLTPYLPPWLIGAPVRRYNAWFCRQFDEVVCHSQFAADELRAVGGQPRVIPLGVEAERFADAPRDERLRAELLGDGRHLLLYVGRLVPEKRVDLLAELMPLLAPRGVRLAVVGGGPLEARLRATAGVRCLGFVRDRDELARLYGCCDLFVHPSSIETFGLGVLEALAAGCRVVAASGGAVAEVLPPSFPTAGPRVSCWLDAISVALAIDPARAQRVARARAAELPWSATASALLELHATLTEGSATGLRAARTVPDRVLQQQQLQPDGGGEGQRVGGHGRG